MDWWWWPPRSPDLTPLDFFFLAYVKNCVFIDKIRDQDHLKARIREAAEQVTRDMLQCLGKKGILIGYMQGHE
jgi:hypothetical protein